MRTLNNLDLILDYKIYLPTDKTDKAKVRGFWRGANGLCYDYIHKFRVKKAEDLIWLKKRYKQEALFYTRQRRAYIWNSPNKIEELKHFRYFAYPTKTKGLKTFLKNILNSYGGFTIYLKEEQYLVEVWR
jgi:hypothetical protein